MRATFSEFEKWRMKNENQKLPQICSLTMLHVSHPYLVSLSFYTILICLFFTCILSIIVLPYLVTSTPRGWVSLGVWVVRQTHSLMNPRRACAVRITVVGLWMCHVCLLPHFMRLYMRDEITKQSVHRYIGFILTFSKPRAYICPEPPQVHNNLQGVNH